MFKPQKHPTSETHYRTEFKMTEQWLADGNELQGYSFNQSACLCIYVCVIQMGHNSAGQVIRLVVVIFCPAS